MTITLWFRRITVAISLAFIALSAVTACAAPVFSQMIVFGDSSVDSGYYRGLSNPGASANYNAYWTAAVAAGAGSPTSSPGRMYPQVLASYFGLTANPANQHGGTNYATSGAKNVDVNTLANGGFKAAIPTVTQIGNYLAANGNHADPNALYLISSGGNDVGFAAGGTGSGPYPANPSAYLTSSANSLANAIASLKSAGGKNFVVMMSGTFSLTVTYNQALSASLANQGVSFIQGDITSLMSAITKNPGQYGFTSVLPTAANTACVPPPGVTTAWALLCSSNPGAPSTFASPNADMTSLYADDQHLATAGQKLVADYVYGLISSAFASPPYQGLWWVPSESGWGMSITQHGSMIFAALYTYDSAGQPTWYVMSNCPVSSNSCTGSIYQVSGGTDPTVAWNGAGKQLASIGTGTLTFSDGNNGTFNFTLNGVTGTKVISRQVFATGSTPPSNDATDMWWNPNESGWGVSVVQQFNTIFATWYTYDSSGKAIWYVASNCVISGQGCTGDLYQVTGGSSIIVPWAGQSRVVSKVGSVSFLASDQSNVTMNYSINGVAGSRALTRQGF